MKKVKKLALTLAFTLVVVATGSGLRADVAIFSDFKAYPLNKAGWLAATSSYTMVTEDFSDQSLLSGVSFESVKGSVSPMGYWHDTLNSWSSNPSSTTVTFPSAINAFGGDWTLGGPGGSGNYLKVTINGQDFTGSISSSYNSNFWGVVSDTSFSEILLTGGTATNQQIYFLDNLVFGPVEAPAPLTFLRAGGPAVAATPLPGAVWLLGGGLLLLVGLRKFS